MEPEAVRLFATDRLWLAFVEPNVLADFVFVVAEMPAIVRKGFAGVFPFCFRGQAKAGFLRGEFVRAATGVRWFETFELAKTIAKLDCVDPSYVFDGEEAGVEFLHIFPEVSAW